MRCNILDQGFPTLVVPKCSSVPKYWPLPIFVIIFFVKTLQIVFFSLYSYNLENIYNFFNFYNFFSFSIFFMRWIQHGRPPSSWCPALLYSRQDVSISTVLFSVSWPKCRYAIRWLLLLMPYPALEKVVSKYIVRVVSQTPFLNLK